MKTKKIILLFSLCAATVVILYFTISPAKAQQSVTKKIAAIKPSKVDFDAFEKLAKEVKEYRKDRLIDVQTFLNYAKEKDVVILDARSKAMFDGKHVKEAINLNFSDFNQASLANVIPSFNTKILIYCNNNFDDDEVYFVSKSVKPRSKSAKELTLALNVPTFINLYGYGYKNVYELSELVSVFDDRIEFEGTSVSELKLQTTN